MATHAFPEAETAIVALILENNPELTTVDPSEDLIESRLIDSLQFVEVLSIIEDAIGHEVDVSRLTVDDFRSLDAITRTFFTSDIGASA
ncbi:phosphopantetheine-binding protein [Pseudonocardia sp. EC080625-04]|uniref:phosphopantetheine-binding protein n=1 Tax=Pseudonocardia sp. EC080625-04 TaxID=1096868 RepID=UPI000760F7E5|nr:phosphopantetheine-binding protein [Pseudonocardia sp. EC080625-04]